MTAHPRLRKVLEGTLVLLLLLVFVLFEVKAETRRRYEEHHVALLREVNASVQEILSREVSAGMTSGGAVFLFTRQSYPSCITQDLLAVFANPAGQGVAGCWHYSGGQIFIIWDDGDLSMYPADRFHKYDNSDNSFPLPPGAVPASSPPAPPASTPPNGLEKSPLEYPERSRI